VFVSQPVFVIVMVKAHKVMFMRLKHKYLRYPETANESTQIIFAGCINRIVLRIYLTGKADPNFEFYVNFPLNFMLLNSLSFTYLV